MHRCLLVAATFLVSWIALRDRLPLCAQETKNSFRTPQEVFDVAKTAMQKHDLAGLCECLTDDSRDLFGGGLTLRLLSAKKILATSSKPDDKLLLKKIDDVLSKHRLTATYLAKFEPDAATFQASNLETRLKTVRSLLEPVKNRNAFVAELVAALQRKSSGNGVGGLMKSRSELTEVKIDGAMARGTLTHAQDGKKSTSTIHFIKIAESWKIDMTAELNKALSP